MGNKTFIPIVFDIELTEDVLLFGFYFPLTSCYLTDRLRKGSNKKQTLYVNDLKRKYIYAKSVAILIINLFDKENEKPRNFMTRIQKVSMLKKQLEPSYEVELDQLCDDFERNLYHDYFKYYVLNSEDHFVENNNKEMFDCFIKYVRNDI